MLSSSRSCAALKGRRAPSGFTLVELLVVVAIIGILSVVTVSTFIAGINRARQKRSIADLRSIAAAIEAYSTDYDFRVVQSSSGDVSQIETHLVPTYMKSMPIRDGWSNHFQYVSDGDQFTLRSNGQGGVVSGPQTGPTTDFQDDIIFSDGTWITWPMGGQQ